MQCCTGGDHAASAVSAPEGPASDVGFSSWRRGVGALFQWALPITTLVLIPKCPGCVAAYVLLLSGVGLSISAAAAVRWALIAISVAAVVYLLVRVAQRVLTTAHRSPRS